MAKGPGPGVRKHRFKHQIWNSLACDYGQVTPLRILFSSPGKCRKKMVKKFWVVPSVSLLPFFLGTFYSRLCYYSPQSPLQVGQPVG